MAPPKKARRTESGRRSRNQGNHSATDTATVHSACSCSLHGASVSSDGGYEEVVTSPAPVTRSNIANEARPLDALPFDLIIVILSKGLSARDLAFASATSTTMAKAVSVTAERRRKRFVDDLTPLPGESPLLLLAFDEMRRPEKRLQLNDMKVSCGSEHTAFMTRLGGVATCGKADLFQLGPGAPDSKDCSTIPRMAVRPCNRVKSVSAGRAHTLVLTDTGQAFAFGYGMNGQLGTGDKKPRAEPEQVPVPGHVVGISAGQFHSAACTSDGRTFVWGSSRHGKLGSYTTERSTPSVFTSPFSEHPVATSISAGGHLTKLGLLLRLGFSCFPCILTQYTVRDATPLVPKDSRGNRRVINSACGEAHGAIQLCDGSVYCFGANSSGQCGNGNIQAWQPVAVQAKGALAEERAIQIDTGDVHTMAVTASGSVVTWGFAGDAVRLGVRDCHIGSLLPQRLRAMPRVEQASAGRNHSMVVTRDGRFIAVGWNTFGMLGLGTTQEQREPREVTAISTA